MLGRLLALRKLALLAKEKCLGPYWSRIGLASNAPWGRIPWRNHAYMIIRWQ